MKKLLGISFFAMSVISPVLADDALPVAGTPTHADPATIAQDGSNNTINPGYALIIANTNTDGNAASAGYVKGAYNASIKAVNTVASLKQDTLTNTNVTTTGTGGVVTAVSASNGAVSITKSNITVPVGSASASTQSGTFLD